MQTFVTYQDQGIRKPSEFGYILGATALSLDNKRLGKQRVEAKQIWTALETGQGWVNHPATKMWTGHQPALAIYGWYMCTEWKRRGFEDSLQGWFRDRYGPGLHSVSWPWWFGHWAMVASHRSKLLRKDGDFYEPRWASGEFDTLWADNRLPYLWPAPFDDGIFMISRAEFLRKDWELPKGWNHNGVGRVWFDGGRSATNRSIH